MAVVHGPVSIKDLCRWANGLPNQSSSTQAARFVVTCCLLGDSRGSAPHTGCVLAHDLVSEVGGYNAASKRTLLRGI